jgi:hypothetical protein
VKWFKNRGHLILETAYLRPDILQTVDRWLDDHIYSGKIAIQPSKTCELDSFSTNSFNQSESD